MNLGDYQKEEFNNLLHTTQIEILKANNEFVTENDTWCVFKVKADYYFVVRGGSELTHNLELDEALDVVRLIFKVLHKVDFEDDLDKILLQFKSQVFDMYLLMANLGFGTWGSCATPHNKRFMNRLYIRFYQ